MLDSLFNVAGLMAKETPKKCFPVKFAKFLRTPVLKNIFERLLRQTQQTVRE